MILCATTTGLPGIRPCTHRGLHRVSCPDHEGWREDLRPGTCTGCLPRSADIGFLCRWCHERVLDATLKWPQFVRDITAAEGRAVSAEQGRRGSAPAGYTLIPLTTLALDECERYLASRRGVTVDVWVHTEDGARDAVLFAHAAGRAYRSLETEERPLRLERVRCPHCDQYTLRENPTRRVTGATVVECSHCGEELDTIRDDQSRWVGSEACEAGRHEWCESLECRCDCHGRRWSLWGLRTPFHLIERKTA